MEQLFRLSIDEEEEEEEEAERRPLLSSSSSFPLLRMMEEEDEEEVFFTSPPPPSTPVSSFSTPSYLAPPSSTPPSTPPPPILPSSFSFPKRKKVKRFYRSSSSSSSTSARSPPVKRLFHRSFSLLLHHSGTIRKYHHYHGHHTPTTTTNQGDPSTILQQLQEFAEALMHVFRCDEFPPEGLNRFHNRVKAVVEAGWGSAARQVWVGEVLEAGVKVWGVQVASPRDGDKVGAVVGVWRALTATTLPILLALLSPLLKAREVRQQLYIGFRDQVLPYAALPNLIDSSQPPSLPSPHRQVHHHLNAIQQMALKLASVGPCSCKLREEHEEAKGQEKKRQTWQHNDNEAVKILKALERWKEGGMEEALLSNLLHLHHGDYHHHHHHHHHHHRNHRHHHHHHHRHPLQYIESVPPSLTCRPASALTLDELLKSAARR